MNYFLGKVAGKINANIPASSCEIVLNLIENQVYETATW